MVTVDPSVIATLSGPTKEIREFTPLEYMAPWMFIPSYLEVCFASCSSVFLRAPLAQPALMEIPSPYPPNWHQLVYEWYAQKKKAQKKDPLKPLLVINGQTVKLKPKFDRLLRIDQRKTQEIAKKIKNQDLQILVQREKKAH